MTDSDTSTRLVRAVRAYLDWQDRPAGESRLSFLSRHEDLRDLLEPMLEDDAHDSAATAPPAAAAAAAAARAGAAPAIESGERTLGDFRLVREIGRGGMGVVYEAVQQSLNRRVALKVLPAHLTLHPSAIARFKREATMAGRLKHPGLVEVHTVGSEGDVHYFAMDLVAGAPLDAVLKSYRDRPTETLDGRAVRSAISDTMHRPVAAADDAPGEPPELAGEPWSGGYLHTVVRIVAQVADALDHAHGMGVLHRDVKPSNILVRPDGSAVLTDFGLSREEGLPSVTMTGEFAGTPYYVAPEQAMAKRMKVDHRADIFSLGATLYEMVTRRRPFEGDSTAEILGGIVTREPPDPQRLNPGLPSDLAAIALKALEKNPDRRYATAAAFADDLRAFLELRPVAARRVSRAARLWRWARRNPVIAALSAALFLSLALGLLWALIQNVEMRRTLEDVRRLSDIRLVEGMLADHNHLRAGRPDDAPALAEWLRRADDLLSRLPEHRASLAALRERALPLSADELERQRATHPARVEAETLRIEKRRVERYLAAVRRGEEPIEERLAAAIETAIDRNGARIQNLLSQPVGRHEWTFASDVDQWQHDSLVELLARFDEFTDEHEGTCTKVREWHHYLTTMRQRSIDDHAAAWQEAIADIASPESKYGGLTIGPQLGLVPIGKDPESGLWEFSHLATGEIVRRGDDGRLVLTDDMGIVFVLLPGGTFRMGSRAPDADHALGEPNVDPGSREDEAPVHEVGLDPFFIAKFEMTQGQWMTFLGRRPSIHPAGSVVRLGYFTMRHPVENVSWVTAREVMVAMGLELPTEAQWEYAARAGTSTPWWTGPNGESVVGSGNLQDLDFLQFMQEDPASYELGGYRDGYVFHAPAGTFPPNAFGLCDTIGNVSEWCRDDAHSYQNPVRPGDGLRLGDNTDRKVIRGSDFRMGLDPARVAEREFLGKYSNAGEIGLRPTRRLVP